MQVPYPFSKSLLFFVIILLAGCIEGSCASSKLSIGPEVYYVERKREGGSKQWGVLYGARVSYDYIKRYHFYLGADAACASGIIRGHSPSRARLKSKLTDTLIEGRLGYTFQAKLRFEPAFTPYGGWGHFRESNRYRHPSPLQVTFVNKYPFSAFGFLSSIRPTPELTVGLNLKMRMMYNGKCTVKGDPDFDRAKLLIKDKLQYRIELPFYYHFCQLPVFGNALGEVGLVPFYESRHYGRRENFPFDFLETRLWIYGANLQFTCRF